MTQMPQNPRPDTATTFTRTVTCPTCSGDSIYSHANPFRPFCCERCKQVDLGAWASEDFRMPTDTPPEDAQHGDARMQH
ncbi:MAG: DNA gyrase inhibitor YacG [Burkholderiaceae bacterium]|nr:DNA gyrase inhibitor YacG [Burkholderiaceae bacterium]